MDIIGIGTDIIEINRIKTAIETKKTFKEKVYTVNEIEYIEKKVGKYESYAGRFAAKEAISKALGTGVKEFTLRDIEILNDKNGKPKVFFSEKMEGKFNDLFVEVSISHCKEYATAMAIIYKKH